MRPIVFLHIPKTAGQTVHHALADMVGIANVSPVRVNEQAVDGRIMPSGYLLHSGHIDWTELDLIEGNPFVFTILRDPAERIASLYFYMLNKAKKASSKELKQKESIGLRKIAELSPDDYFFGGDPEWQSFIHNNYYNFYCTYFITKKMNGYTLIKSMPEDRIINLAIAGSRALSQIYYIDNLEELEKDIARLYRKKIEVVERFLNPGPHSIGEPRWTKLIECFHSDKSVRDIQNFIINDKRLLEKLRNFPSA